MTSHVHGRSPTDAWRRRIALLRGLIRRGQMQTSEGRALLRHQGIDVDSRRVLADFKALSERGVPLRIEGEGRARVWSLMESWRESTQAMDVRQRLALRFGHELVAGFLGGTDVDHHLNAIEQGLARDDTSTHLAEDPLSRRLHCIHEPEKAYRAQADLLRRLLGAILEPHAVAIEYVGGDGNPRTYPRIEPLTLVLYKRGIYLMFERRGKPIVLAVERIHSLVVLDDTFVYPPQSQWSPEALLDDRFGLFLDPARPEPEAVRIRFAEQVKHLVHGRRWHPSQRVVDRPDGGCDLHMHVAGRELVALVTQFGDKAEALEPEWLRRAVGLELRRAAGFYDDVVADPAGDDDR